MVLSCIGVHARLPGLDKPLKGARNQNLKLNLKLKQILNLKLKLYQREVLTHRICLGLEDLMEAGPLYRWVGAGNGL